MPESLGCSARVSGMPCQSPRRVLAWTLGCPTRVLGLPLASEWSASSRSVPLAGVGMVLEGSLRLAPRSVDVRGPGTAAGRSESRRTTSTARPRDCSWSDGIAAPSSGWIAGGAWDVVSEGRGRGVCTRSSRLGRPLGSALAVTRPRERAAEKSSYCPEYTRPVGPPEGRSSFSL